MLSEDIMQKLSLYFHEIILVDTLLMIKMKRIDKADAVTKHPSDENIMCFVNTYFKHDDRKP